VAAELLKHQHSSSAPVSAASLNSAQLQSKMSATVAFSGPQHQPRNFIVSIRHVADIRHRRVWSSVLYFRRTARTNGNLGNGLTVTTAARFCQLAKYRLSN